MNLMILTGRKKGVIYDVSSASIETKDRIAHILGRKLSRLELFSANTFIYHRRLDSFVWFLSHYKGLYGINSSDYYIMTFDDRECLGEIE